MIALFSMLVIQSLNLAAPLLVKSILDDQLVAIKEPWYETVEKTEKSVLYNGKYYQQQETKTENVLSVVIVKGKYYAVDDIVIQGNYHVENNTLIVTDTNNLVTKYNLIQLDINEVKDFYSPFINPLIILLVLLVLRYFLQIAFLYIQRTATSHITINIIKDARIDAIKALTLLPMDRFEKEPAGKIANRIINDVNGINSLFNILMNLMVNATLAVVFAYIGMFYLNWQLSLITFVLYPIIYIWLKAFIKRLRRSAEKTNESRSMITAQLNEIINGIGILQVYNYKDETIETFNQVSNEFRREQLKESRLHLGMGWNLIRLLGASITALIILYFGYNSLNIYGFVATAGLIYAYNDYLSRLVEPVMMLFREIGNYQHAVVRSERLFNLIDSVKEDDEYHEIDRYKGKVVFDGVWFSYVENQPVLKGIDLTIDPGQMIGIVGHTGSGKSTLMNLLLRFYDFKDDDMGNIYIDDLPIDTYSKRTYRKHIGIILQDPIMFKGTLADNIRFGAEASDELIEETLRLVGGGKLLDKLEFGIHQKIVRGGSNLSVGEKQIISFARAILHNPSILIMDEATANIDTETEEMIQRALEEVKKNRTTIVIAHRLSTIKKANKIVVLENGLKVEEGTHEALLKNNSVYANIYRSQVKIEEIM